MAAHRWPLRPRRREIDPEAASEISRQPCPRRRCRSAGSARRPPTRYTVRRRSAAARSEAARQATGGISSAGRATALQAVGQGFESPMLHPSSLALRSSREDTRETHDERLFSSTKHRTGPGDDEQNGFMAAPRINDEQQRVLWFWRMLELCSPQRVPKVTQHITHPEDRRVIRWLPSDPPPWKRLKHPKPLNGKSRVWQHTVYLGVYELEAIYDWLHHAFADDKDAYDERRGGLSACAGLLIDQQGQLVPESTVLSSALWAVARIMYPGPQDPSWTRGFTAAQQAFNEAVVRYENDHISQDSNEPLIHDARTISDLLHIAHDVSGISGARRLATDQVIVESKVIFTERAREEPDIDFLNSFYLDDLTTVLNHASSQEGIGSALATYLTADHLLDTRSRVDVLKNPEVVDTSVSIDRLPKGRWPSNPEHGLALSQQFAVNEILHGLTDTNGLMGVNGPPGTGKTTMLRDILAGNVVERARRLAKIENPRHAFRNNTYEWNTSDGHTRRVRQLRAELTGFEMVVASANNAAVENVTTEIPAQDAIDSRWWQDADYFGDIATAVFQTKTADGKSS